MAFAKFSFKNQNAKVESHRVLFLLVQSPKNIFKIDANMRFKRTWEGKKDEGSNKRPKEKFVFVIFIYREQFCVE
jgi:hypothetical protein